MKEINALSPASNEWISYREPALKLIDILSKNNLTLSAVDGCGGHLLNQLTIPGATKAFRMGVVASNWEAKIKLGVPETLMYKYGEFSLQTAKYLASLALNFHKDQIGLAVVGDFVAIAQKDKEVWGTQLLFPSKDKQNRQSYQFALSQSSLSLAYMYIQGRHQQEKGLYRLPPLTKNELIDSNLFQKIQQISYLLSNTEYKIATMESCSGGALACAFESVNSSLLNSAWVAYDEDAKIKLGVPINAMSYGTVYSERVVLAMAQAIQKQTGAKIALATTGTMDTADTRPFHTDTSPGTVYTAIYIQEIDPIVKKLKVPLDSREMMKAIILNKMVDDLLILLSTHNFPKEELVSQKGLKISGSNPFLA